MIKTFSLKKIFLFFVVGSLFSMIVVYNDYHFMKKVYIYICDFSTKFYWSEDVLITLALLTIIIAISRFCSEFVKQEISTRIELISNQLKQTYNALNLTYARFDVIEAKLIETIFIYEQVYDYLQLFSFRYFNFVLPIYLLIYRKYKLIKILDNLCKQRHGVANTILYSTIHQINNLIKSCLFSGDETT